MEFNKEFKEDSLNIEGYSIIEVGRGKVKSDKFRSQTDFEFDPDRLIDVLNNKGHIYAYVDKAKKVRSIYVTTKSGETFSCEERMISPSIVNDPVVERMDEQVRFLVAERATYYTKGKAFFLGEEIPKLKKKSEGFDFVMFLIFTVLYSMMFWQVFHGPVGICIGFCMGISMGLCLAKHSYYYEKTE